MYALEKVVALPIGTQQREKMGESKKKYRNIYILVSSCCDDYYLLRKSARGVTITAYKFTKKRLLSTQSEDSYRYPNSCIKG